EKTHGFDCEYFGRERDDCREYTDDAHQDWIKADGELKSLILELIKSSPQSAQQWTKVGDDLSLYSFRKAHNLTKQRYSKEAGVEKELGDFLNEKRLVGLSSDAK